MNTAYKSKNEIRVAHEQNSCYLTGERLLYYLSTQRKVKAGTPKSLSPSQSYACPICQELGFLSWRLNLRINLLRLRI